MRPKMLLAVDGSELSNKAVEHVGNVVCQCKDFEITLLHVVDIPPSLREHEGSIDPDRERMIEKELADRRDEWLEERCNELEKTIFQPARQVLKNKGVTKDTASIHTKVAADVHSDVAFAIINEAKQGDYGILVIGRRGKSTLKEFLMGAVVHKVMHQQKNCAVWVVE
jgi:nucleotide-binding universal stress UspA family protein